MMLRIFIIIFLTVAAVIAAIPTVPTFSHVNGQVSSTNFTSYPDPNATRTAFNYTLSQADLFTKSNAVIGPPSTGTFNWFSTFERTSTGTQVPNTAFNFTVANGAAPGSQQINWTFPIPRSTCFNCINGTIIRFTYQGNLTTATSANYTLAFAPKAANSSAAFPTVSHTGLGNWTGQGVLSSSCPSNSVCISANKYVGYNMTLSFKISWNTGHKGLKISVGEVLVGAISNIQTNSLANWMSINSTDSTKVNHTAKLLVNLFNSTTSYPNPFVSGPRTLNHTWSNQIMNFYYPSGYNLTRAAVNSTVPSNPIVLLPSGPRRAFESTNCFDQACSQSLLAINMSDIMPIGVLRNSTFTLSMLSRNTLHPTTTAISVTTGFGTVPIAYFAPGDNMTVKVTNKPSAVNMTIAQANPALTINFTDPMNNTQTLAGQTFSSPGGGLFGITLPQGPVGQWNATVFYTSNFDLGFSSTKFRVNQLVMSPQTVTPTLGSGQLNLIGKIVYNNSSQTPAASVTGVLFAADATSGAIPVTSTNSSTSGLYISNATIVNGVFTRGQTLSIFFTVANPSTQQYNANLTIQHEWTPGQTHGLNQTIQLRLGDEPFNVPSVIYKMEVTLVQNGILTKITSVQTQRSVTVTLSNNVTTPVIPTRQQTGLFKISITSAINGTGLHTNTIETPPYAYVLAGPETSSGYLTHSGIFTTQADGKFSASLPANQTIGAGKLVIFALARDSDGVPLWSSYQDPTSATDNTRLVASADRIGEVTVGQTVASTLHLRNNSTLLAQTLTIDLYLDNAKVNSQPVTLTPGQSTIITFHFQAPSQPGAHSVTYSSAQYRTPLASQTIQVVLIQGLIQLLIPLIIGVIAAIAVLGYYLVKRRPPSTTTTTTTKPATSGPRTRMFTLQMFN